MSEEKVPWVLDKDWKQNAANHNNSELVKQRFHWILVRKLERPFRSFLLIFFPGLFLDLQLLPRLRQLLKGNSENLETENAGEENENCFFGDVVLAPRVVVFVFPHDCAVLVEKDRVEEVDETYSVQQNDWRFPELLALRKVKKVEPVWQGALADDRDKRAFVVDWFVE